MCGIAGILQLEERATPVDEGALRPMASALRHRGPDDEGLYCDPRGRCGLAFRRLSVIDLALGRQPIRNEDGTVWLVFNGEIYNFRTLRADLEARGHRFATASDSEVIVHLYEEHGADCFALLEGMFAIAIWDERTAVLTLARDRLGQKPLAYAVHNGRLRFASELKAIIADDSVPRVVDPAALHAYLLWQYVPAPQAIYRGFVKLPPGHLLEVRPGQPLGSPRPFWSVPRPTQTEMRYEDAREQLGELLTRAVEKRLIADVPLGAFLSGGIDSSLVVALMRKLGVSPLRTFTIGFSESAYDETTFARQIAARFETEHHEQVVTPQATEVFDTLAWHYDEPFADSSAIPTYYLARWTREHVTVALTGDAGDECFGGYDRYRAALVGARADWLPGWLRTLGAVAAERLPGGSAKSLSSRARRFFTALALPAAQRYCSWVNVFPPTMLRAGYRRSFLETARFDEPLASFLQLYDAPSSADAAQRCAWVDLQTYLPFDLLTKVDIASMACGLECRSPMLDHDVVAFAQGLPSAWKLGAGGSKRILKDWARDLLPAEILKRPKMGFGVPVGEWFRGPLRGVLEETVLHPDGICACVFERSWLERLVQSHVGGKERHDHRLWSLLMLSRWASCWEAELELG